MRGRLIPYHRRNPADELRWRMQAVFEGWWLAILWWLR